jgi:hypothetical protein
MVEDGCMVFHGKKSCVGIGVLFLLAALISLQSTGVAAGEFLVIMYGDPYECYSLFFDVGGSYGAQGAALQYRWNFNGSWTEWSTASYAEHMWLDDFSGPVMVEVSDGSSISTAMLDINILNVPPFIITVDGPAEPIDAGMTITVAVHYFDGDLRDGYASLDACTALFLWGDGTSTSYLLAASTDDVIGTHVYSKAGNYTIMITITDDDGGMSQESLVMVVTGSPLSIDTLRDCITEMNIPSGLQNSFLSKLVTIDPSHMSPNGKVEMNKLGAFINSVEAQRGKKLSGEQADALIHTAEMLIESLKKM